MKQMKRFLCTVLTICLLASLLTTAAFAVEERSSAYLNIYSAFLTADGNGEISVTVDVSGRGYMTEIGAKTIYIYESDDNARFTLVATYEAADYPEMLGTGTVYYETPIVHEGTVGKYYSAVVEVHAGNASGSDTKDYEVDSIRAT